jgi:hypothetical protein
MFAKKKKIVLRVYNSGTRNKNGHIVEVSRKKAMAWSKSFNCYVPYVWGSFDGKKPNILLLSRHFKANKEPKMNYYVYAPD